MILVGFSGPKEKSQGSPFTRSGGSHSLPHTAQAFGLLDSTFILLLPPRRD